MVTGYTNFKVEIKNVKYIADDGRTCPRTAIVTLIGHDGEQIGTELFGVIETSEIYKMINDGNDLNLDNFYISEFSLATYRRFRGMDKKDFVELRKFSARNAFFEAKAATDFSFSSFSDDDIDFDGAHFARGKVSFSGTNFGKGNVTFSNTFFRDGNIEFTGAVFGDGDFLFKNAIVRDSTPTRSISAAAEG
jgi:hypothetical protein